MVTVMLPPLGVGGGFAFAAVTFCVVLAVALGGTAISTVAGLVVAAYTSTAEKNP